LKFLKYRKDTPLCVKCYFQYAVTLYLSSNHIGDQNHCRILKNWFISHYIINLETNIGGSFNNISWKTLVKVYLNSYFRSVRWSATRNVNENGTKTQHRESNPRPHVIGNTIVTAQTVQPPGHTVFGHIAKYIIPCSHVTCRPGGEVGQLLFFIEHTVRFRVRGLNTSAA
jgi:hypothetical protein